MVSSSTKALPGPSRGFFGQCCGLKPASRKTGAGENGRNEGSQPSEISGSFRSDDVFESGRDTMAPYGLRLGMARDGWVSMDRRPAEPSGRMPTECVPIPGDPCRERDAIRYSTADGAWPAHEAGPEDDPVNGDPPVAARGAAGTHRARTRKECRVGTRRARRWRRPRRGW